MEYVLVFSTQRGNLKLLAIATPHQSRQNIGSEVPIAKKSSFPSGEAEGKKPYAFTIHPTVQFRELRADAIRPYSLGGEAAAIQRTARLRTLREAKSLPYWAYAIQLRAY